MPDSLSTILVASDGSDESRLAIERGVRLSQQDDAALHIIHVGLVSQWVHPDTLSPKQYEKLKQQAEDRLETEVAYAETVGGAVTQAHRRMGKPASEIIQLSEELNADLVLLGSRGRNTLERIVLGNDSEDVVRYAPCSVMVVRKST